MKLLLAIALVVLVLVPVQWEKSVSGSASVQCREDERLALLHINASMSFPIHSLDGKWEGKECCRWERVTCHPITGHVTQLDLSISDDDFHFNNFNWGISLNASMFLPLRQLRSLSLSGHGIHNCTDDTGFESWSSLTKLHMLDLSFNELPGSTISSLAKVSSLRALYLDYSYYMIEGSMNVSVKGSMNVAVKELSALNLEVLSLCQCAFSGSFPYLGHWSTSLKALSLAANDLNDTLTLEGLCQLKNLEELDLSGNFLIGNLPLCMGNLSFLKLVDLSYNQFQVKFPSSIFERLMSLTYLDLSGNLLEGTLSTRSFLNHSNLEVLKLSILEPLNFRVEVIKLPFQLQDLELANCILDVEPTFFSSQHRLRVLDLSNTRFKGPLSAVLWLLLENNTNLIKLDLRKNFFTGPLQLPFLTHEKLSILDISDNHLGGELPVNITTKLPNLLSLKLSKNYFQGPLPLMPTGNLKTLDLSSNNLTDDIHNSFLRIQPSIPSFMDLSNNNFYGSITYNMNFTPYSSIILNNNNISGYVPFRICNTSFDVLDIGNNELNGVLPDCIGRADFGALKLSGNHLEGSLPLDMCVEQHRWLLDLSDNNLSGSIPPCSNQTYLTILHLSQNNITGNFPITWLNLSDMHVLDIGENYLSGELPIGIGMESLANPSMLNMLLARDNVFGGPIPEQICQLRYLSILDLSHNNLSGEIPSCITDMGSTYVNSPPSGVYVSDVSRVGELNFSDANFLLHIRYDVTTDGDLFTDFGLELISKRRLDFYWGENILMEGIIDLSSNKLVGNIPKDIGQINWLTTLNLSNNHLSGAIPNSVSNLHLLESLDLSHNSLTGKIPRELTKLTSLESFSVAYNNLSGPTLGVEAQFSTFDNSSYEGNPNLCGPPMSKSCVPPLDTTQPSPNEMSDDRRYKGTDFLIFYCTFSLFFVVSFWCFIAILYFKRNWRYALFTLVDKYGDMIYM